VCLLIQMSFDAAKQSADMTTYPLDKPNYFSFQDSASEVSYTSERI